VTNPDEFRRGGEIVPELKLLRGDELAEMLRSQEDPLRLGRGDVKLPRGEYEMYCGRPEPSSIGKKMGELSGARDGNDLGETCEGDNRYFSLKYPGELLGSTGAGVVGHCKAARQTRKKTTSRGSGRESRALMVRAPANLSAGMRSSALTRLVMAPISLSDLIGDKGVLRRGDEEESYSNTLVLSRPFPPS